MLVKVIISPTIMKSLTVFLALLVQDALPTNSSLNLTDRGISSYAHHDFLLEKVTEVPEEDSERGQDFGFDAGNISEKEAGVALGKEIETDYDYHFVQEDNFSNVNESLDSETDLESLLQLGGKYCSKYSCEGSCGVDTIHTECSCNSSCKEFGNCCLDYFTDCLGISVKEIPDHLASFRKTLIKDSSIQEMLYKYGTCRYYNGIGYVNVINTCPENSNTESDDGCQANLELMPVKFTGNNILNFANIHCALCHGFGIPELSPWTSAYDCPNDITIKDASFVDQCVVTYKEKRVFETLCFPSKIPKDETSLPDEKLLCNSYIKPVYTEYSVERNVYCAKLNGVKFSSELEQYKCEGHNLGPPLMDESAEYHKEGLRVLFDINNGRITKKDGSVYNPCNSDEIYDPFFLSCRQFVCPEYEYPHNGKCYRNETVFMNSQGQPFPLRNETVLLTFTYYSIKHRPIFSFQNGEIITVTQMGSTSNPPMLCQLKWKKDERFFVMKIEMIFEKFTKNDIDTLAVKSTEDMCFSNIILSNYNAKKLSASNCKNSTLETFVNSKLVVVDDVTYAIVKRGEQNIHYDLRSVAFKMDISDYVASKNVSEIHVCEPTQNSCRSLVFNMSEYEKLENSNSIKIKRNGAILKPETFKFIDEHLYVCDFYYIISLKFFALSPIQHYLGIVLSGISMICLFFTIMTYAMVREMRTIAGKMTAFLSFFLLLGQALVMVKVENQTVCMAVAAINHFVWLSVFCWMSAIAYNMALTFWKTSLTSASEHQYRFKRFVLFSIVLPLTIVGVGIGLEYSSIPYNFKAGYGQSVCSWLAHKEAILIMFYAPVGFSILFNILCFIFTLCGIEKSLKVASLAMKESTRSERRKIFIYAKLSSIMGFTWIIGYIAAIVEHESLWYLYVICNGLQGTFIFLSFICNRRTLLLIGCRCLSKKSKKYENSTSFNTQTTKESI